MLLELHENNLYESDWLTCVRDILHENNLGYIWETQGLNVSQQFVKTALRGVDRHMRCQKCDLNVLGDEYHIFFECNNTDIVNAKRRFVPLSFHQNQNRSMYNFVQLMKTTDDIKIVRRVSSFIKFCDVM